MGVCSLKGVSDRRPFKAGHKILRHRGPDDEGIWWSDDCKVGLYHRRLKIIDLSENASQPMVDAPCGVSLVFNGEIYNHNELREELIHKGHPFKSGSDTEVILRGYIEWGIGIVDRLIGMFAMAIYDIKKQKVFLARDRAGEKPLFYWHSDGEIRFASELKALLADNTIKREVDLDSLGCFLYMGYVPGDKCILSGFTKLMAGHFFEYDLKDGQAKTKMYWKPPRYLGDGSLVDFKELTSDLETVLEKSVSEQLVADVPVGILLSGGLDSSLITAYAARSKTKLNTFTVSFPDHHSFDEASYARQIADYFGTNHIELNASTVNADLLSILAYQYDEPIIDSSMIPTFLVAEQVKNYCSVALGGDGGDELFGGYKHYSRLNWLYQNTIHLPKELRISLAYLAVRLFPVGFKGRNWLQALAVDLRHELPLIAMYFDYNLRQKLFKNSFLDPSLISKSAESTFKKMSIKEGGLATRAMLTDFHMYLPEDILVKVDRASMLNSLEIRSPFLNHKVIEFAFSKIPVDLKVKNDKRKIMLAALAESALPADFAKNRKQGFSIPLNSWLHQGHFRKYFEDVLMDDGCCFNPNIIRGLFKGIDKRSNNGERLFGLLIFELWRRAYNVSL